MPGARPAAVASVVAVLWGITGSAYALPESDVAYAGSGTLRLGAATLSLDGTRILRSDGSVLADRLYTPPVTDGRHLCASDDADGLGRLRCWNDALQPTTVAEGGRPDRLALSGDHLAWVASPTGLPQVHIGWVDARAAARALTNVGLQRVPGQAPAGFVPPPLGTSLRFDGDLLRWDTPSGPRQVVWP